MQLTSSRGCLIGIINGDLTLFVASLRGGHRNDILNAKYHIKIVFSPGHLNRDGGPVRYGGFYGSKRGHRPGVKGNVGKVLRVENATGWDRSQLIHR